jgi:hypothetical protein
MDKRKNNFKKKLIKFEWYFNYLGIMEAKMCLLREIGLIGKNNK